MNSVWVPSINHKLNLKVSLFTSTRKKERKWRLTMSCWNTAHVQSKVHNSKIWRISVFRGRSLNWRLQRCSAEKRDPLLSSTSGVVIRCVCLFRQSRRIVGRPKNIATNTKHETQTQISRYRDFWSSSFSSHVTSRENCVSHSVGAKISRAFVVAAERALNWIVNILPSIFY